MKNTTELPEGIKTIDFIAQNLEDSIKFASYHPELFAPPSNYAKDEVPTNVKAYRVLENELKKYIGVDFSTSSLSFEEQEIINYGKRIATEYLNKAQKDPQFKKDQELFSTQKNSEIYVFN